MSSYLRGSIESGSWGEKSSAAVKRSSLYDSL